MKYYIFFAIIAVSFLGIYSSSCLLHTLPTCVTEYGTALPDVWQTNSIGCARACKTTTSCQSFVFFEGTQICRQNTGLLTNFSLPCGEPMIYGAKDGSSGCSNNQSPPLPQPSDYHIYPYVYMSDNCTVDTDCEHIPNAMCISNLCLCIVGYKFEWSSQSCVTTCTEYGNSYQADMFVMMDGFDNLVLQNQTEPSCLESCTNTTEFTCVSAEWDITTKVCNLSSDTALTQPQAMINGTSVFMYHRDCLFV